MIVPPLPAYARWRGQARAYLLRNVAPEHAAWIDEGAPDLFDAAEDASDGEQSKRSPRVPPRLVDLFEEGVDFAPEVDDAVGLTLVVGLRERRRESGMRHTRNNDRAQAL